MYKRLATNTVINIANLGLNIVINFALAPLYIRALGDELYGIWVFVVSLSVLRGFLRIFDLGIQSSLVKFVAEYETTKEYDKINEIVSASLLTFLGISLVVSCILAIFNLSTVLSIFNIPAAYLDVVHSLIWILIIQTILDFIGLTPVGFLEGLQRYDITRAFNIVRILVFGGTSLLFLSLGWSIYALAAATFISELVRFIGHIYWARRLAPFLRLTRSIHRSTVTRMMSLSSKVFIYALANTLYEQMDKLIISLLLTTTLLTDYDISYRLHTLVFAFTTLIGPFVVPAASSLNAVGNKRELSRLFLRATLYTGVFTVPVAAVTIALAEPLTRSWMSPDYVHTVPTTQIFIAYLLFGFMLRVGQNILIGINKLNIVLPTFILGTLTNLVISSLLAQQYGVIGVVWGTFIGNLLIWFPYMFVFKREFEITNRQLFSEIFLRIFPQAAAAALTVVLLMTVSYPGNLFQVGLYGASGIIVFATLFVFTGLPNEEREYLKQRVQRLSARKT